MNVTMRIPFLGALILGSSQKLRLAAPGIEKRLARLEFLTHTLIKKDLKMIHEIEDFIAEVADIKSVIDAVIANHATLIQKIDAAVSSTDLSAVAAAVIELQTQTDRLRGIVMPTSVASAA